MDRNDVSLRLRTLREQRKLRQVEVAEAVGVARPTLSAIERGHDVPGRETLLALATYYGVSLDWLATGEGSVKPGEAVAKTEDEALLLFAYRQLPDDEAKANLAMLLTRVGGLKN